MARYVLLRIEDDDEADDLLRDMARYPQSDLLTPCLENTVHAEVVPDLDPSDFWAAYLPSVEADNEKRRRDLMAELRRSYERAGELAAAAEAEL